MGRAGIGLLGVGAVGLATLWGAGPGAGTAQQRSAAVPAEQRQLRADAETVHRLGVTGVLAQRQDADGHRTSARAGAVDREGSGPVPYGAYHRIGSSTKTFTSVVALQLVAEGRLTLTDTVERWLPGVVTGNGNDGTRITVRNLLQQTSGLPEYTDVLYADPADLSAEAYQERRFTGREPAELVALALTREPHWLPDPDDPAAETRWAYSNTNYLLAGMVVEKVTGHPWERAVHERIIEPLGLRHTLTAGTSAYVPQPTASAYTRFPGSAGLTDTTLSVDGGPDGGIISTVGDMNTFLRALMRGDLLPADQLAEMKRTVPADAFSGGPGARYGLGLAWRPVDGCDRGVWYHGGTSFGTVSVEAVTEDGATSAATAAFTIDFADEENHERQGAAVRALVEHAVCGR